MLLVHGKVHYGRARRGRYLYVGNPEPWEVGTNSKGCDIGYALAADSCEGVNSVDTCTVTALDATTAFAVPNPGSLSQVRRFFRVRSSDELPHRTDRPAYFGLAILCTPTLSAIDGSY